MLISATHEFSHAFEHNKPEKLCLSGILYALRIKKAWCE